MRTLQKLNLCFAFLTTRSGSCCCKIPETGRLWPFPDITVLADNYVLNHSEVHGPVSCPGHFGDQVVVFKPLRQSLGRLISPEMTPTTVSQLQIWWMCCWAQWYEKKVWSRVLSTAVEVWGHTLTLFVHPDGKPSIQSHNMWRHFHTKK